MDIDPPLLNSSNPWATTLSDLRDLYACDATGAVTTRTSLLGGFPHDAARHRFCLFDPRGGGGGCVSESSDRERVDAARLCGEESGKGMVMMNASLNTLGYSYHTLDKYLEFIATIVSEEGQDEDIKDGQGTTETMTTTTTANMKDTTKKNKKKKRSKPKWFIVSVTGTPGEVAECYRRIYALQNEDPRLQPRQRQQKKENERREGARRPHSLARLAMEVNLSCPNIPGKPPPAYSGEALREYVAAVSAVADELSYGSAGEGDKEGKADKTVQVVVPWGVKTPPYTFSGQFEELMSALRVVADDGDGNSGSVETEREQAVSLEKSPVSFITATNTLGSCLVLSPPPTGPSARSQDTTSPAPKTRYGNYYPALPGLGIGGMAGAPLHPLALGNVATLRRLLDGHPSTRHIGVIGIGGVEDAAGYRRMRDVGAFAVGVGTALGVKGLGVFEGIEEGLGGVW